MALGGWHASYKPKRCTAYPTDLRWCMVYQREALNLLWSYRPQLGRGPIQCTELWLFLKTGNVDKKQYNAANLPRKLTDQVQFFIMHTVLDKPGIMLAEIQKEVLQVMNVELSQSTICKFFHSYKFSRQEMQITAKQRWSTTCFLRQWAVDLFLL